MTEVETRDGKLLWRRGKRLRGDRHALQIFESQTGGRYGAEPGVPAEDAASRKDSFLDLVAALWPDYKLVSDTEPEEEFRRDVVY